jgi:hypothetical protein
MLEIARYQSVGRSCSGDFEKRQTSMQLPMQALATLNGAQGGYAGS